MNSQMNPAQFLLAIPVYNEETYVDHVLDKVRRYIPNVLVVDDGSTDGTARRLAAYPDVTVLRHMENHGYGKSLADAIGYARRHDFPWLITMDCDGQHNPACLPAFVQAAQTGEADIISGTRYPAGRRVHASVPADRLLINREVTAILNKRLGLNLTDAFCGYKAYRVQALRNLCITVPGYAMPIQLWVQAAAMHLSISELPVELIYNDPNRHFGGMLDDPAQRLQHYLDVLESELARYQLALMATGPGCASCS